MTDEIDHLTSTVISLETVINNSFDYDTDDKYTKLKDSENIPEFFNLLKFIWTSLTDVTLYDNLSSKSKKNVVIPFMHDAKTRELISQRVLKYLNESRGDDEDNSLPLKSISQGHLLTCFKILSSLILCNDVNVKIEDRREYVIGGGGRYIVALINLIEIFMYFVPSAVDISVLFDFLIDLVKTLSVDDTKRFARYLYSRMDFFKQNFLDIESMSDNKRLIQTSGAKFIGLIKIFENNLDSNDIFDLRFLLTYCLPISHLGVCNRQSLSMIMKPIIKDGVDEWNNLGGLLLRNKIMGLSDYEVNTYESIASSIIHLKNVSSSNIYDLKAINDSKIDKPNTVESFKLPTYEIYSNYCNLLNFILNPEIILEKTLEYIDDLQKMYNVVLLYINSLTEKSRSYEKLSIIMEYGASPSEFISRCNNISYWMSFLLSSCLAIQTLKLSHKKTNTNDTTYSLLRDKCATTIDSIEKNIWNTIYKIDDLSPIVTAILAKEKEWVQWKQSGCTLDVLEPITDDVLLEDIDEVPTETYELPVNDVTSFISTIKEMEEKGIDDDFILEVDDIRLNRQSHNWYLDKISTDEPTNTFGDSLLQKLSDYQCKLLMDEDPANDICESEKVKHNDMFRFRFARLFSNSFIENYMTMSNDDIASGSVDCLLKSMNNSEV